MSQLVKVLWPEVFTNPDFEYAETKNAKKQAMADAYTGWANCTVLGLCGPPSLPDNFGKGMVKIGNFIGTKELAKTYPTSSSKRKGPRARKPKIDP